MAQKLPAYQRLRAWRDGRHLGQEKAASLARMGQSSWSFVERGLRPPTLSQSFRIEKLTGGDVAMADWVGPKDRKLGPGATCMSVTNT